MTRRPVDMAMALKQGVGSAEHGIQMNIETATSFPAHISTEPRPIIAAPLNAMPKIRHGFFTREGGVSSGIFAGLNVGPGSSDNPADIQENRRRVAGSFAQRDAPLSTPHQVHSTDVISIAGPFVEGVRPRADAIVTTTAGVIIGVLTADCGPVLFADEDGKVAAAAHAGWKGAIDGILENTIEKMIEHGAHRDKIHAVLGPVIGPGSYEVGPEFLDRFVSTDPGNCRYFEKSANAGRFMFNLPGYILARLAAAEVHASVTDHCTYADEDRFFSYRRTTHRGEPDYGRQISAIMLEP